MCISSVINQHSTRRHADPVQDLSAIEKATVYTENTTQRGIYQYPETFKQENYWI